MILHMVGALRTQDLQLQMYVQSCSCMSGVSYADELVQDVASKDLASFVFHQAKLGHLEQSTSVKEQCPGDEVNDHIEPQMESVQEQNVD